MKKKFLICLAVIVLLAASFFTGGYVKEQKHIDARVQCCRALISFAFDKAENKDFTDQSTMRALASNIYAAYQFCDDVTTAAQLHDLWNYLLDCSDEAGVKEVVMQELKGVLNSYNPPKK